MIAAIIIDDEKNSQDIIELILNRYCPEIQIVACGDSCATGISLIKQHRPDLVFLDLEMADGNGFDVLDGLEILNFEVIFITAYEKRFLHAIRFSEIEVILKPVDKDALCAAVTKAIERIRKRSETERYRVLLENIHEETSFKIVLPSSDGLKYLTIEEIIWLEQAEENTLFHLNGRSPILAGRAFRYYCELFGSLQFFQVTNSKMINLRHLKKPVNFGSTLVLQDGSFVEITPRRKKELQEYFKMI